MIAKQGYYPSVETARPTRRSGSHSSGRGHACPGKHEQLDEGHELCPAAVTRCSPWQLRLLWGGGDFSGGMGVKHAGGSLRAALRVVLLSHLASFTVLVAIAKLRGDAFPHGALLAWGVCGGVVGGLSLTCFYIALSRGAMGVSAAVSGLLAAAIPALVASLSEGSPGVRRVVGFCVAGAGDLADRGGAEREGAALRKTEARRCWRSWPAPVLGSTLWR